LRRWKLVGLAGIGIALLALGIVRSPWRDLAGEAGIAGPTRFAAREVPDVLAPEATVLRGALAVSFAASTPALAFADAHDLPPFALDLAAPSFAGKAPPVTLPEPPRGALALGFVAGLRALGCRRRAR
jgi:hypothetical protein